VELFPSFRDETRLHPPQGFFEIQTVNYTWSNHWHHHNARSLLLTAPQIIDLPLNLDGVRLSLSLDIISLANFAHKVVEIEAHFVLECPLYSCIIDHYLGM
jgi:hypothetical protein